MKKLAAPIVAGVVLVLAAGPVYAQCFGGHKTQSVQSDQPVSTPVDTASTTDGKTSG